MLCTYNFMGANIRKRLYKYQNKGNNTSIKCEHTLKLNNVHKCQHSAERHQVSSNRMEQLAQFQGRSRLTSDGGRLFFQKMSPEGGSSDGTVMWLQACRVEETCHLTWDFSQDALSQSLLRTLSKQADNYNLFK